MKNKNHPINHLEPIVALTGAGISAESGVPTFRGEHGLWKQHHAQDLATSEAFEQDPHLVWQFYDWRRQVVANCKPNPAHITLADIERSTREFLLITQNVDGLHSKAGSENLLELHGSLWVLICTICGHRWYDHQAPLPEVPPRCQSCAGLPRPDVVWFGELLDQSTLQEAENASRNARTMLVIGTSALVKPASLLPLIARNAGAHVIEFNLEPTLLTPHVDECYHGPAGQLLPLWWKKNNRDIKGKFTGKSQEIR